MWAGRGCCCGSARGRLWGGEGWLGGRGGPVAVGGPPVTPPPSLSDRCTAGTIGRVSDDWRPLRRAIQREVDNPLSRLLLDGRLERGQRVTVGVRDGRLDFAVDQPATAGV